VAAAADSDGAVAKVSFLRDGVTIGEVTLPPFQLTVPAVPAGTYTFVARAVDSLGAVATSPPSVVTVVAPNLPPAISLTSPAEGSLFTTPATIVLAASASDADGSIARVEFLQGATIIGEATTAPFSFTW